GISVRSPVRRPSPIGRPWLLKSRNMEEPHRALRRGWAGPHPPPPPGSEVRLIALLHGVRALAWRGDCAAKFCSISGEQRSTTMSGTWGLPRTIRAFRNTSRNRGVSAPARRTSFKPRLESLEDRCVPAVDVILEWNAVMLEANAVDHSLSAPEEGGPTLTGRAFAIVSVAMYDAYNSIHRIGDAYLTMAPKSDDASSEAAVAQAARDTLVALYPSHRPAFDAALTETLARVPDGAFE